MKGISAVLKKRINKHRKAAIKANRDALKFLDARTLNASMLQGSAGFYSANKHISPDTLAGNRAGANRRISAGGRLLDEADYHTRKLKELQALRKAVTKKPRK